MVTIRQLERNTQASFHGVKTDVHKLYNHIIFLSQELESVKRENQEIKNKLTNFVPEEKKIIASKKAEKVHREDCLFAKNIKTENMRVFDSKEEAFDLGLKPCKCLR